jgi:hypothetical protein
MVPYVHPTGLENQEVLVTVRSKSPATYEPPMAGKEYPTGAHLAAYTLVEIPILDVNPQYNYIQVDTPNGGEVWDSGGTEDILWTSVGAVGDNVKIQYSINDGAPLTVIDSTQNDGSFLWAGLPALDSNQVRIIVKSVEKPLVWDESDDFFTIGLVGTLEVTSPNGGEVLPGGWKSDITWNSTGPVGNVIIELSLDSGQTWPQVIVDSTENDGIYTWDPIPWINKNTCRVRITDLSDPTVYDESDADFSITQMGESLTLIQPNGGEVLQIGGTYEIKWSWIGDLADIRIELSTDSGATYPTVIVPFTECDGSYTWDPIPDLETSSARVCFSTLYIPHKTH